MLFAASLLVNVWLLVQYAHLHDRTQALRLDPLGLEGFAPEPTPVSNERGDVTRVAFVGDSRAWQWPAPDGLAGFRFVNAGRPGETSAQSLGRFERVAAALAADVVVIQTGVNDLQIVTHFADDARVVERCRGNLERLAARARAGGAAVVVTTIFPVGEAPATWFSPSTTQVNADIRRVNDGIHSMSGDGVFVLDAHALLQDARGLLPERHAADWLHLNSKGYAVLNLELVRLLSEIGRSAP